MFFLNLVSDARCCVLHHSQWRFVSGRLNGGRLARLCFFFFFFGFENATRPLKELPFALPMGPVPTGTRELWGLPVMVGSGCQHMDGGVDKMRCKYMCFGG
jgi:hypothetical protein